MNHVKFLEERFESTPGCRNSVIFLYSDEYIDDLSDEYGFLKNDSNRLCLGFETNLIEQNDEFFDDNKLEEESTLERFLKK